MKRLVLITILLAACDDPSDSPDAPVGTADAQPDALVSLPDAPPNPGVDAGPGVTIPMACERVCNRIPKCFMEAPDPTCPTDCAADLADCTQAEVEMVFDCGGVACSELKNCVGSIACIMG